MAGVFFRPLFSPAGRPFRWLDTSTRIHFPLLVFGRRCIITWRTGYKYEDGPGGPRKCTVVRFGRVFGETNGSGIRQHSAWLFLGVARACRSWRKLWGFWGFVVRKTNIGFVVKGCEFILRVNNQETRSSLCLRMRKRNLWEFSYATIADQYFQNKVVTSWSLMRTSIHLYGKTVYS